MLCPSSTTRQNIGLLSLSNNKPEDKNVRIKIIQSWWKYSIATLNCTVRVVAAWLGG
jgi:hypothetical protein